ncbi:MAG: thioredoxin domain-containing protein, partial [Cyclobacteriaceae bacterium]|nr:thioredoxin domain-containing protein [Cyclobacteriaceae bacterium]
KKFSQPDTPTNLTEEGLTRMFESMQSRFDKQWGGLEKAPKFVMPTQWQWLLRYYAKTKNPEALEMVNLTLKRMAMGGLYDQVGGGFSRYSVDGRWFAPHFEKMLYDNAQLLTLYSEAYSIKNDEFFKTVVAETVAWLEREMTHPEGGFYSALDADSEGEEGKYYVWTKTEFDEVIGSDYPWLAKYYSVTDSGNWEHGNNILFIEKNTADFIQEEQLSVDVFNTGLAAGKEKLKARRDTRIRPGLDDKILTSWNAMMITGLCDAYKSFGERRYLDLALRNIQFLEEKLIEDKVYRSFRGKRSSTEGFLEDYAFLISAYISLYHVSFNELWLEKANHWTTYAQEHFFDHKEGYYHFTASQAQALIARKKEIFDNVIPSANGIMAANLFHLGIMLDNQAYQSQARKMVSSISHLIEGEPAYTSHWGMLYSEMLSPLAEVAVVGGEMKEAATQLNLHYLPFAIVLGTETQSDLPLLQDKTNPPGFGVTIFVCFNKTCKLPVHSVEEALMQIP